MTWGFVSASHEQVRQLLSSRRGAEITKNQWEALIKKVPGAKYIHPSDHCSNMNNKGACDCALTERALVKRLRRGVYRVL
jgi:hypothetical protein